MSSVNDIGSDSESNDASESNLNPNVSLFGGWESEAIVAIFEVGLQHASPKLLMGLMSGNPQLNTEHLKSHLQKFRKYYTQDQILTYFDEFMKDGLSNFLENERNNEGNNNDIINDNKTIEPHPNQNKKNTQKKRKFDWEKAVEEVTLECAGIMEKLDGMIQKQEKALEMVGT
jgi:hypothetical protein